MAPAQNTTKTIGQIANVIKSGNYFGQNITINFNVSGHSADTNGLTTARADMVRDAFTYYQNALGITFKETDESPANTILFKDTDWITDPDTGVITEQAFSTGGPNANDQSTINISPGWNNGTTAINSYSFATAIHEIGHSLALTHTGHYDASDADPVTWNDDSDFWNDTKLLSTMSYFRPNDNDGVLRSKEHSTISGSNLNNATLMAADYYALMDAYGIANGVDSHQGYTKIGRFTNISAAEDPVWNDMINNITNCRYFYTDKAAGNYDSVIFSNFNDDQVIDLRVTTRDMTDAHWSNIGGKTKNLAFGEHAVFEKAYAGSGDDKVYGNHANNILYGNAGHDLLIGLGGNDYINGGSGNDRLYGYEGNDRLYGEGGNDYLKGATGNDSLYGGVGNDTLKGGLGRDYLEGGQGNDQYYVDQRGDEISERINGGHDTVYSTANSITLANNVEDVILQGSGDIGARGNTGRNIMAGNSGDNWLWALQGDDIIGGGDGRDRLYGGSGKDILDGGRDSDTFVYFNTRESGLTDETSDVITGFTTRGRHADKIDLSVIDAWTHAEYVLDPGRANDRFPQLRSVNNNNAFKFIGGNDFSYTCGEVRFENGCLQVNNDRDLIAEMEIKITGLQGVLSSDNFIL